MRSPLKDKTSGDNTVGNCQRTGLEGERGNTNQAKPPLIEKLDALNKRQDEERRNFRGTTFAPWSRQESVDPKVGGTRSTTGE